MEQFDLDFIKKRRISLDLTLDYMARSLSLSGPGNYHKYENGQYKFRAEQLPKLAILLECKISDLYVVAKIAN